MFSRSNDMLASPAPTASTSKYKSIVEPTLSGEPFPGEMASITLPDGSIDCINAGAALPRLSPCESPLTDITAASNFSRITAGPRIDVDDRTRPIRCLSPTLNSLLSVTSRSSAVPTGTTGDSNGGGSSDPFESLEVFAGEATFAIASAGLTGFLSTPAVAAASFSAIVELPVPEIVLGAKLTEVGVNLLGGWQIEEATLLTRLLLVGVQLQKEESKKAP